MKRAILLLLVCLATAVSSRGAGLIVINDAEFWPGPTPPRTSPPPPHGRPVIMPPRPAPFRMLEVNDTRANIRVSEQIAVTSVEQEFYNPNSRRLQGTFLFPLPKGAQINKFTMEIDGKQVEAELLAADKARGIYEDIVRRAQDPALLEFAGRDLFKVRIFPIEPRSTKKIVLSYTQVLKADNGLVALVCPLNAGKYSATPIKKLAVAVDLSTRQPLKSLYSPSHRIDIRRQANHATIGYEATDVRPDADFQLFFSQEEGELGANLLTQKRAGQEGHFLLLATPGFSTKEKKTAPKDVTFVVDTSGSMAGNKLEQAKKALQFCVENLNANDRFEIVRFSTETEQAFNKLTDATKANRKLAQEFIDEMKPLGGTAIDLALRKAMALRPVENKRPYVVIFMTDGLPTVGTTDQEAIIAGVKQSSGGNTRVFCFGIGTDVNTHLLDRIAEDTRAFGQYVLPEEDIEVKVSNFFTKIKEPALANVKITFPEGAKVAKQYPFNVPDLFKGEQLVLAGTYQGKASGKIVIEGTLNGEPQKFTYEVNFPDESKDHEFIPRLWATRRVGYLLDEIRLRGESMELRDEVTELARKHGIVTPYTAYLIVEDEARRNVTSTQRSLPLLELDREARDRAADLYRGFKMDKAGDAGVAGSRHSLEFKRAEAPADAVQLGRVAAERAYNAPAPASPPPVVSTVPGRGVRPAAAPRVLSPTPAETRAKSQGERLSKYTEQNRFVNGRSFFQNEGKWVDAEVQKLGSAKTVRVKFNSPEYFELVAKHPEAAAWLAVGSSLQLVLDGIIYDIYEG